MRNSPEYDGERPETIEVGANRLVGTGCDWIRAGVIEMLDIQRSWNNPYGEGMGWQVLLSLMRVADFLWHKTKM